MALEKMGLDFCCGGKKELKTAVSEKGLEMSLVVSALKEAVMTTSQEPERNWTTAGLTELCDYIESKHHSYMRENLPLISNMLARVKRAHAEHHGQMLVELEDDFISLREEIEAHLAKEEQILFPYIRQIEAFAKSSGEMPEMHCRTIANPIRQMEHEHENAGEVLARMREITGNYTCPEDACETFKGLYQALDALEKDLHEHIHLENNILFPRAIELENATGICSR
jgi:regulator of cell morphogenesis and NO signaling